MKNKSLKPIQKECLRGKLSVDAAVNRIDQIIGGITSVRFQSDLVFSVYNHDPNQIYELNCKGLKKRFMDKLHGLAAVAYAKAQKNGSIKPGEVHISAQASTRHYMPGIEKLLMKYAPAYAS